MNTDYLKRKHESPFAADDAETSKNNLPKIETLPTGSSIKRQSPFAEDAPLDSPAIPILPNRIAVRYTWLQPILGGALAAFFGLMTVGNLWQLLTSRFTTLTDIIYKGVLLHGLIVALVSVIVFLLIRAKRRGVRFLDASGVTRGDNRHFPWKDFRGRRTRTGTSRYALIYVWRVELVFAGGETAWLIPQRVKNSAEVFGFVNRLPAVAAKDPSSSVESRRFSSKAYENK